jgi:type I restriction-modification system DNA methylase subunit
MYGQELNPESYAICKADMLIKGQDIANIIFGNTLSNDGLPGKVFDYALSNPPFGVEWKKIESVIRKEAEQQGYDGRFGPGLPRVSDGSLLFLLHLISKMRPEVDGGSRFGIVLNGSPLFTGGAGSGESEIRRAVLENDMVEAIIALPTDMFYNTGISTYVWIVSNRKPQARKGKVQLIDASSFWQKMRKSLGSKRKELSTEHIDDITRLFGNFEELTRDGVPISRIFVNEAFGYSTITVERPERDAAGNVVLGLKGIPLASIREVQSRWVMLEDAKCTTEYFYESLIEGGRKPLPGDLIFSRNATVGEVAQVSANHPRFAMGQDVVLLRKLVPSYSSDYLQHVIRSPIITLQLANMMIGSTFKRINVEEIRSFFMPSPPPPEQAEIATFLEQEVGKFDTLTDEAQRAIDLLQERRTALISAAVTGQIDVRTVT